MRFIEPKLEEIVPVGRRDERADIHEGLKITVRLLFADAAFHKPPHDGSRHLPKQLDVRRDGRRILRAERLTARHARLFLSHWEGT